MLYLKPVIQFPRILGFILGVFTSTTLYATDPFTDSGKNIIIPENINKSSRNEIMTKNVATGKNFKPGSLNIGGSSGTQSIEFQAFDYKLALSDNIKLPFQLYLAKKAPESGNDKDVFDTNQASLLDPKTGATIAFYPWKLNISEIKNDGICSFEVLDGACSIGIEVDLSHKVIEDVDGNEITAFAQTLGLRSAFRFPILQETNKAGYLHISPSLYYSRIDNIDDSSMLFSQLTDAAGNPVVFKDDITFSEIQVKWEFPDGNEIFEGFSVILKWVSPLDNKEQFKDRFSLTLEKNI